MELRMKDNAVVNSLEELREHYDEELAFDYLRDGTLEIWLEDLMYEEAAEEIQALKKSYDEGKEESEVLQVMRRILGVDGVAAIEASMTAEEEERLEEKKRILNDDGADEAILENAAITAITQADLAELLKKGATTIYLYGKASFNVPVRQEYENRRYIGILGKPSISVKTDSQEELDAKNITLENVMMPWDSPEDEMQMADSLVTEEGTEVSAQKLTQELMDEYAKDQKAMGHVNIIIAGKTGVGKSTLINAAFQERMAETGIGRPVTQICRLIEKDGMPLRIYDTVGLEMNDEKRQTAIEEMKGIIQEKINAGNPDEFIHCMWYCVNPDSDRFEESEDDFISEIATKCAVPVVLVLTKAYLKGKAETFAEYAKSLDLPVKEIRIVLAEDYKDKYNSFKAYGLAELVEATIKLLPESAHRAWVRAQKVSLLLKRKQAEEIISQSIKLAFGAGFNPLPIADAALLITIQGRMFIKIANVYGVKLPRNIVYSVVTAAMGMAGATAIGMFVTKSLLKFFPVIGLFASGLIGAPVASAITSALGHTFIWVTEKLYTEELSVDDLERTDVQAMIKKQLEKFMAKEKPKDAAVADAKE